MYHHRYQPQTSNQANRNPSIFANNINLFDINKGTSPATSAYQSSTSSQSKSSSLINSTLTPAASVPSSNAISESPTQLKCTGSGSLLITGNNHRNVNSSSPHSSPFSSLPKQFVEERQDVIFRRVRGILNKITPETFDKLTKELVNVGLDSPRTLRGVIYLLFDKALKDLKYSSLYAKLCQELSEKAPNFEREPGPNTFCKFLISKCEDEFERRRKATEDFDSKNELTGEEFEQKIIAKQKMLGNIKFICELGKKRLLQEEILHECIRGLLSKKKKEKPIQEQAQDLECLCQIMRTIGSLLDIEASRNLMNQYFERIDMFSKKPELPSRIRFMLRDVIDLRNNNWRPRPFQREDNVPQPLSKLREELGFGNSNPNSSIDKLGNKNIKYINDLSKLSGSKLNSLLLDDEPSFTTTTDFHWGSSFLNNEPAFDIFSDVVNNAKVGSANSTNSNHASIGSSSSKPSVDYLEASNFSSPVGQSAGDFFGNYKMGIGTDRRIDPFSDSYKSKHNLKTNVSSNINNNDGPVRLGTNDCNQSSQASHKHVKSTPRDSIPPTNGPNTFIRSSDNTSLRERGNNPHLPRSSAAHSNNTTDDMNHTPGRKDQLSGYIDKTHLGDTPRPQPPGRRLDILAPDARQHPVRPSEPPFQNYHNTPRQQIDRTHISSQLQRSETARQQQDFGPPHEKFDHKDRKFTRGMADQRQPRFSGANYKLPGRERHNLSSHVRTRDRVSEVELSQNWRAGVGADSFPKTPNTASNQSFPTQLNRHIKTKEQLPESIRLERNDSTVNNIESTNSKPKPHHIEPVALALSDTSSSNATSKAIDSQTLIKPSLANAEQYLVPSTGSKSERQLTTTRGAFKDDAQSHDWNFDKPNRDKGPRRDSRQPALHPPSFQTRRQNNQDFKDKRDAPRRHIGAPIEFDGRVFQRPYHNESSSLERKNFRPAIPRNQSFDGPSKDDAKKPQTWRRDGSGNNLNPSNSKDSVYSAIMNPLLPKTSPHVTDLDFSLRPSHNLAGRALNPSHSMKGSSSNSSSNAQASPITTVGKHKASEQATKTSQESVNSEFQDKQTKSLQPDTSAPEQSKSDLIVNQFVAIFSSVSSMDQSDIGKIVTKIKELKLPKQNQTKCLFEALKRSIVHSDRHRSITCKLLTHLIPSTMDVASLINAYQDIFGQLHGMEVETPKVKSLVASHLSQTTTDGLLTISDVAGMLVGGKHHPMFLLYLQKLENLNGKAWLSDKFIASKISLIEMLPEVDRSKDRLAVALKDRCLGFLDPMLTIEPDLWEQMKERDPSPTAIYRWIKENVDQSIQNTTTFAYVFVLCLLRYIHNTAEESVKHMKLDSKNIESSTNNESQSNKSSPVNAVIQAIGDCEKDLLSKYQHILQAILKDKPMQLASLYALQTFYHSLEFPKGAILRWFHLLYDLSIVDDDVFFTWKEEINDNYPGKGQALFQVNTWLHWLAEAESEEDDEE